MTDAPQSTLASRGTVGPKKVTRPKPVLITYETRHLLNEIKVDGVIKPMTRQQMAISLNGNPVQWEFTAYSKFGASTFDGDKKFAPSLGVAFPIERNPELKEMEDILVKRVKHQLLVNFNKLWNPATAEDRRTEKIEDCLKPMSRVSKTEKGKAFGANYRAKITDKTKIFTDDSDIPIPEASLDKKVEGMYTVIQSLAYIDVTTKAEVFVMCYTDRILLHKEVDDDDTPPFQTVKFRNTSTSTSTSTNKQTSSFSSSSSSSSCSLEHPGTEEPVDQELPSNPHDSHVRQINNKKRKTIDTDTNSTDSPPITHDSNKRKNMTTTTTNLIGNGNGNSNSNSNNQKNKKLKINNDISHNKEDSPSFQPLEHDSLGSPTPISLDD